ncbi:class II aaRS and biotin synthetase [Aaosphaeria arxii CBS 175.79]|uniref:threonine--tRNA ligase n=1 Tax=Aaosphaeria arxii CBS 175.79 TaxID=1450172 RepID=A0A6A5XX81_9PLEO|nr:class II aaRS and biotin synthetase [Aaosphaeria arxii CBS 175.79]KAF2017935.1 class II aaRS and biotin synthetase [Aaosphaeria arxii CBS 175.79]
MLPLRALLPRTSLKKTPLLWLRYSDRNQNVKTTIRSCSCSTRPLSHAETAGFSTQSSSNNQRAQLNPTTSDPPTPQTDHRTLAQTHNLFITSPYSPGSPLLLPNGTHIFQKLQAFLRAQYPQFGFREVVTPTIYKKSLWEASGHWDNYADDMFSVQGRGATGETEGKEKGEDEEFGLKPMNCPGHCLLFREGEGGLRSWRDLPVRYADFSALHRNEISGTLTGLTRVRRFHQDDAHIFCRPDQILSEIERTLEFVSMVYETFNLGPYKLLLSTRPDDHFIGTIEEWTRAESQLTTALNNSGREWSINAGDGAFYGPKIDIILKDNQGKEHQTATIQLDFQLPQRFDLQYQASPAELAETNASSSSSSSSPPVTDNDNNSNNPTATRRPVIIHRAIYGSLERFMALLIEHYSGTYPFWLSPRPATILSVNTDPATIAHVETLQSVLSGLLNDPPGSSNSPNDDNLTRPSKPTPLPLSKPLIPITTDVSARPLGKKIAEAKAKKYNHIVVVGPSEVASGRLNIELANQPHADRAVEVLKDILGPEAGVESAGAGKGNGKGNGRRNGNVKVGMEGVQARRYFERLMDLYL